MNRIRNTNDGSSREPYLRPDIHYANVKGLPFDSSAPQGNDRELHQAIQAAGFKGVQDGGPRICKEFGLGFTGHARVNRCEEAAQIAQEKKEIGCECVTLHVGWGMEDDDEVSRLLEAVLMASLRHDIPLYVETHRATITQDMWRTVQFVGKFPEIRFNGDFSHWYNGQEMVYGGFEAKLEFLNPVFERVRFLHGRVASPGAIQVATEEARYATALGHFREMWTRSMLGFLRNAQPGDYLCFTPELLGPEIHYARLIPAADGEWKEETDRWQEAQRYRTIALECWKEAVRRTKT